MKNIDYDQIVSEYDKIRLNNIYLSDDRKNQIYEEIPRIKEIDDIISENALSKAKARILKKDSILASTNSEAEHKLIYEKSKSQLKEEKKNLLLFHGYPENYLDPIYTCSKCKDTGYVDEKPCSCMKQRVINQLYSQSNIKNVLEAENFGTFNIDFFSEEIDNKHGRSPRENIRNILDKCKVFINAFDTTKPGILLYGETGTGKTFLSNCIAKEILDRGHTVLYVSANQLFERILPAVILENNRSDEQMKIFDYIYKCDLLVIDDLGTEMTNNFVLSQLFEIINTRKINGLSTVISSNLDLHKLRERYTDRIVSRIFESFITFNLYGDNIRVTKRAQRVGSFMNLYE